MIVINMRHVRILDQGCTHVLVTKVTQEMENTAKKSRYVARREMTVMNLRPAETPDLQLTLVRAMKVIRAMERSNATVSTLIQHFDNSTFYLPIYLNYTADKLHCIKLHEMEYTRQCNTLIRAYILLSIKISARL
ncbi:Hypothetical predicted protein [Paramuricea clavata]|nr:Hypothetical predicted protein [Paramuricea clavata]